MDRAGFFAALSEPLKACHQERLEQFVRRRLEGEPLAYIAGHREFYGLDFSVNHHVLIPRQETELLVEKTLEFANRRADKNLTIADVGTGSGAIAVAIAVNLPHATIYATDVDPGALKLADNNRRRHNVTNRVHLSPGDLLHALNRPVDVIVSNPPYIKTAELDQLAVEVRREPRSALDGGPDGLNVIRHLLSQAHEYVRAGGGVFIEIAPEQLETVMEMAREVFPRAEVSYAKDLLRLPRMVGIELDP